MKTTAVYKFCDDSDRGGRLKVLYPSVYLLSLIKVTQQTPSFLFRLSIMKNLFPFNLPIISELHVVFISWENKFWNVFKVHYFLTLWKTNACVVIRGKKHQLVSGISWGFIKAFTTGQQVHHVNSQGIFEKYSKNSTVACSCQSL